jgi:predicted transcriptional regulator
MNGHIFQIKCYSRISMGDIIQSKKYFSVLGTTADSFSDDSMSYYHCCTRLVYRYQFIEVNLINYVKKNRPLTEM